tara:strand:- start:4532 stop:5017 length:486 start_codon:yes stop_codon:yes gene_type:complete
MIGKKGGIFEIFSAMALFLAISMIAFISAKVGGSVLGVLQNTSASQNAVVNQTINAGIKTSQMGDVVFLILFCGYILAMILTSMAVNFHPGWFFIFVLLSILGVVIAAPISNAYATISQSEAFNSLISTFPVTDMIMLNLPFVIAIISGILLIITYARSRI